MFLSLDSFQLSAVGYQPEIRIFTAGTDNGGISPNARDEAEADAPRVFGITRQLRLQHAIFENSAADHGGAGEHTRDEGPPRAQQQRDAQRLQYRAGVTRMPDNAIRAGRADHMAALILYTGNGREEGVREHGPTEEGKATRK